MISQLKLASLALSSNPTTPGASLVKVEDGYISAYGGEFCIRVPIEHDIGAAFSPHAILPFFRKERTAIAYTIKFPKLTLSEGKERLTVNCIAPEDVHIIDNIETTVPCSLNIPNLKRATEILESNVADFAQGVTFRDNMILATNNKVFFCGASGVPSDFGIPREAAKALLKFPSKVVGLSRNDHTAKFVFEDGSSLCSHILDTPFPDINPLFKGDWQDFEVTEDILALSCEKVHLKQNSIFYHAKDTIGELVDSVVGDVDVACSKKYFDCLLRVNTKMSYVPGQKIMAVGTDCSVISSVMRG